MPINMSVEYPLLEQKCQQLKYENESLRQRNEVLVKALREIKGYNDKILPYTWATYKQQIDTVINQIEALQANKP